jgi:prephenate dehydratase
MRLITLGPAGTYCHRVALSMSETVSFHNSVTAIVKDVSEGKFDRGIIPIENSIEGSVTESLSSIVAYDIAILQEVVIPIKHALLAQSKTFDTITSHPQAIAQCRSFISSNYPGLHLEPTTSTASGISQAIESPSVAAIGHPESSNGKLKIIAKNIQDQSSNSTRFFVIAPPTRRQQKGTKTSVIIYPHSDYSGLLLEILQTFSDKNLNLTRIESRPSGNKLGDYLFHIDFEAAYDDPAVKHVISQLEGIIDSDGWIRFLGSYDVCYKQ